MRLRLFPLLLLLTAALLAGCSSGREPEPVFVAPTLAATRTAPVDARPAAPALPGAQPLLPSATPTCVSDLVYIQDLTIPDGSVLAAGAPVDKRWQVRNAGSCGWNRDYRLKRVDGPALGAGEQALFPARAGTEAVLQVTFEAPSEPGTYQSAWQAVDPQGQPFGEQVFLVIEVR